MCIVSLSDVSDILVALLLHTWKVHGLNHDTQVVS